MPFVNEHFVNEHGIKFVITKIKALFEQIISDIKLINHPIGSVYISFDSTSPEILFGGVWQECPSGQILSAISQDVAEIADAERMYMLTTTEVGEYSHPITSCYIWKRVA